MISIDLLLNSIVSGILLGGYYAAISIGISISFGMLDIVNIAHPAFILFGAYCAFLLNTLTGIDPILAGILFAILFFFIGMGIYKVYYRFFERRGSESMRGLVFFFGMLFLFEVIMKLVFGVELRSVKAFWIGESLRIGAIGLPLRMLFPFIVSLLMTFGLYMFFSKSYLGLVSRGVSQNSTAIKLMGAKPRNVKTIAFSLSIASASIAGALMISIGPVEPYQGRNLIGRVFAIAVMSGIGSMRGTLLAAIIIGVIENLAATLGGPAWATGISFSILLIVLAVKPSGLFGRRV